MIGFSQSYNDEGCKQLVKKQYKAARESFELAAQMDPKFHIPHINLAFLNLIENRQADALKHITISESITSNCPYTYFIKCLIAIEKNDNENAIRFVQQAIKLHSKESLFYIILGDLFYQQFQLELATTYWNKASEYLDLIHLEQQRNRIKNMEKLISTTGHHQNYCLSDNTMKTLLHSIILMLWIMGISPSVFAEKITIKGLDIQYNEITEIMTASGNAELNHPDFKVLAEKISYNKKTGIIIGQNNVELIRDNQIILSEKFTYNAKNDIIEINKLWLELNTKNKNQQFFSSAEKFKDFGNHKIGKNGVITTCDYDPPHYYFKAKSFTIYPEKRIIAQDVQLVNPVLFLPLGFLVSSLCI